MGLIFCFQMSVYSFENLYIVSFGNILGAVLRCEPQL